ncbi:hypothetical protein [Caulobacter sp. 17J65-9]|uniref:hypothetical protein n=1 Tax=Caulobacter sp. 17J65-9 TaxID=2709382 RepID=UPI0013C919D8|nr:hypothetical protein [Caulobacter sp. 17J65-9]NEX94120.1 hypothetical protein [Caulobacter sp. 17J65-9]
MLASLAAALALAAAGPTYSGESYDCSADRRGDYGRVFVGRSVRDVEGQPVSEGGAEWHIRDVAPRLQLKYGRRAPGAPLTPVWLQVDVHVKPGLQRHSWLVLSLDTGAQTRQPIWGDAEIKKYRGRRSSPESAFMRGIYDADFLAEIPKAHRLTIDVVDDQGASLAPAVVELDVAAAEADIAALLRETADKATDYRKLCRPMGPPIQE